MNRVIMIFVWVALLSWDIVDACTGQPPSHIATIASSVAALCMSVELWLNNL